MSSGVFAAVVFAFLGKIGKNTDNKQRPRFVEGQTVNASPINSLERCNQSSLKRG
jgi:hypothetical protein